VCSWHIMSRLYHGSNRPWMALLINHPTCPIPAKWVHELSCSFVGDLSANVPRTGVFIPSNHCPCELQLPMYECFSIPVWVLCKQDFAFDLNLRRYHPSKEAIAQAPSVTNSVLYHLTCIISHTRWASGPWAHVVYILDDDGWAGGHIISVGDGWAHAWQ
jgi:hypothetical protein